MLSTEGRINNVVPVDLTCKLECAVHPDKYCDAGTNKCAGALRRDQIALPGVHWGPQSERRLT